MKNSHKKQNSGMLGTTACCQEGGPTHSEEMPPAENAYHRCAAGFPDKSGRNNPVCPLTEQFHEDDIIESALVTLSKTEDLPDSILSILAALGKRLNLSRCRVVESGGGPPFPSAFEWLNENFLPGGQNRETLSSSEENSVDRLGLFDEEGLFCCYDVNVLPPAARQDFEAQGIWATVRYTDILEGRPVCRVSFDNCLRPRS